MVLDQSFILTPQPKEGRRPLEYDKPSCLPHPPITPYDIVAIPLNHRKWGIGLSERYLVE